MLCGSSPGALELTGRAIDFRQVEVEGGNAGPQGGGFADQLDPTRMVALLMSQHAEEVQSVRVFLLLLNDLPIQLGGRTHLAGPVHFEGSRQEIRHITSIIVDRKNVKPAPDSVSVSRFGQTPYGRSRRGFEKSALIIILPTASSGSKS